MIARPKAFQSLRVEFDLSAKAVELWRPGLVSAKAEANEINILGPIGADFFGDGITAEGVHGELRRYAGEPVTVNVNSPGGDLFEGLAIHSLLRDHDGDVTVKVLGLAASAGSIIAMGGDDVQIARAGFLMIHNSWVLAVGNRHDLRSIADTLEPFDRSMASIYSARTGMDTDEIAKLMDGETWIGGEDAIEQGFADALLAEDQLDEQEPKARAAMLRRAEQALRKGGLSRAEARRIVAEIRREAPSPQDRAAAEAEQALAALDNFLF